MKHSSWTKFLLIFLLAAIDPVVNQAQVRLFPISENGKWGLMDADGKIVLPPIYSAAIPRGIDLVEIRLPGGRGLIDRDGKELLPPRYAELHVLRDSVVWFREGAKWGYLHLPTGNQLPPIYLRPEWGRSEYMWLETLDPNDNSGHVAEQKILHTLVSPDAQVLIPPMEATIERDWGLRGLMKLLGQDKKVGIWDLETGLNLPPVYEELLPLSGKRFAAVEEKGDRYQLIDLQGNRLAERGFDELKDLKNGWLQFRDSLVQGLINRENRILIQAAWEDMKLLGEHTIAYKMGGEWGMIRADSTVIFKPQFTTLTNLRNGSVHTRMESLEGPIEAVFNLDGDTVIAPGIHHIRSMAWGPGYVVETAAGQSWHDAYGFPSEITGFTEISNFERGLARIRKDSLIGMMDSLGRIVVPVEFTKIDLKGRMLRAYRGEKERVFAFDDEGHLATGNRFILVRGDESNGSSNSTWQQLWSAGWFLHPASGKWGLRVPNTDSIVISPRYDRVVVLGNTGLARVEREMESHSLYGLVDHRLFRKVIDPVLTEIHDEDYFQGNMARITLASGRRALLSRRGKIIQSNSLRFVGKYSEGKARVMLDGKLKWENANRSNSLETRTERGPGRRPTQYLFGYDGKWGFIDGDGKWLCRADYDFVEDFQNGIALVMRGGKWGAIDSTMRVIVPVEWDHLARLNNSPGSPLVAGRADGGTGYVSIQGEVITGPGNNGNGFEAGKAFSEGLAAVKVDGLWGYTDRKGSMAIEAAWDEAGDFHEGLAWVRKGRTIKIIDRYGNTTDTEKGVFRMGNFHEGLAPATAFGRSGYLDASGRWAIEPQFLEAGEFEHGLAVVRLKSGRGMIDKGGNEVLKARYQRIMPFENGMAVVYHNGKYGFVDSLGQVVVAPRYLKVGPFREGLAMVKSGNWKGFVNMQGEVVIKGNYRELKDFSNGLAAARVGDRWGYLDREGKMVIEPQYIVAHDFENGRSLARERSNWHLIDTLGNDVVKPVGSIWGLDGFQDGMARGRGESSNWFYLDSLGNFMKRLHGKYFEGLVSFHGGIGQVQVDGAWHLVDRSMQPLMSLNFLHPVSFQEGIGKAQFGMKYGMYSPEGEVLLEVKYDRLQEMGPIIQVGDGAQLRYIRPDGTWVRGRVE